MNNTTSLDLSGLDETLDVNKEFSTVDSGSPKEINVENILPNPNNPRKEFDEARIKELADSIIEHGVNSPISVSAHPTKENKWVLNYGERRLRASKIAGNKTIPCFISDELSDYARVIENLQRDNLTPMELAEFIHGKLEQGLKASEIAKKLGKHKSFINEHIALKTAPEFIQNLYINGKTKSPRTIYDISKLYQKEPKKVEEWCDLSEEVSRKSVADLKLSLEKPNSGSTQSSPETAIKKATKKSDTDTLRLIRLIEDKIGLPVLLGHNEKGSGKVSFKFNSFEELDGLLKHLKIEST